MEFVISGGSGFLGTALTNSLLQQGHVVTIVSRTPAQRGEPRTVTWSDTDALAKVLASADVVFNFAGANVAAGLWTEERKAALHNSRIRSTRALVELLPSDEKRRTFVSMSASGFYGDSYQPRTETDPPGTDFLAMVCQDWEKEAHKADSKARVVCVRTGIPLHPSGGVLQKLLPLFRLFLGGHVGSGKQWFPWIHLTDAIRAYEYVAMHSDIKGAVNIVAPEQQTLAEFCRELGRTLGRPSYLHAPEFLVKLAGEVSSIILNSNHIVPNVLDQSDFSFSYPTLSKALQELLKE